MRGPLLRHVPEPLRAGTAAQRGSQSQTQEKKVVRQRPRGVGTEHCQGKGLYGHCQVREGFSTSQKGFRPLLSVPSAAGILRAEGILIT